MKKWEAIYMPSSDFDDPSKSGFDSEREAWEYAASHFCDVCKELFDNGESSSCDAEWMVGEEDDWGGLSNEELIGDDEIPNL